MPDTALAGKPEVGSWSFATQPQQLIQRIKAIPATDKRLMLEESNLARWISQLLKPHVQQIVVCDARRNRLISQDHHKHDQRDAFALARLLRLNEFKPVWQPTEDQRVLFKRIAKAYENAVQRQTRLKLQLKSLFQHWGLFPAGASVYSKPGRVAWLKQLPYDPLRAQALFTATPESRLSPTACKWTSPRPPRKPASVSPCS